MVELIEDFADYYEVEVFTYKVDKIGDIKVEGSYAHLEILPRKNRKGAK